MLSPKVVVEVIRLLEDNMMEQVDSREAKYDFDGVEPPPDPAAAADAEAAAAEKAADAAEGAAVEQAKAEEEAAARLLAAAAKASVEAAEAIATAKGGLSAVVGLLAVHKPSWPTVSANAVKINSEGILSLCRPISLLYGESI